MSAEKCAAQDVAAQQVRRRGLMHRPPRFHQVGPIGLGKRFLDKLLD
jgi:hypothetical protein